MTKMIFEPPTARPSELYIMKNREKTEYLSVVIIAKLRSSVYDVVTLKGYNNPGV